MTTLTYHRSTHERLIFWAFILLIGFFAFLYGLFLQGAVRAVVERKQALDEQVLVVARVSELEARYIALQDAFDLAYAHEKGFVDVPNPIFVSRLPFDRALTMETVYRNAE